METKIEQKHDNNEFNTHRIYITIYTLTGYYILNHYFR